MSQPKILLWDVETSHNIVATFNVWNVNISPDLILQEWFMICAAWQWFGETKIGLFVIKKTIQMITM